MAGAALADLAAPPGGLLARPGALTGSDLSTRSAVGCRAHRLTRPSRVARPADGGYTGFVP